MKKIFMLAIACALISTSFANLNNDERKDKKKQGTEQCCKKKPCCDKKKCCKPGSVKS